MQTRWDIIGHVPQLGQLDRDLAEGNLAHAYLFSGPPEIGKFKAAKKFASLLLGEDIEKGIHPDVLVMPDEGETIKIDAMRELIRKISLTAQNRRIVLIENIERMPHETQNAFLKTLEEPPSKTVFLLTTGQINEVLQTILSRVRHLPFGNVSSGELRRYLEGRFGTLPMLDEILMMAQGRPGLAMKLIKDPQALADQRALYLQIESFLKASDLPRKFQWAEALVEEDSKAKNEKRVQEFLDAFTRYVRKAMLDEMAGRPSSISERFPLPKLASLFESLEKSRYFIQKNINKKLVLENLLLETE